MKINPVGIQSYQQVTRRDQNHPAVQDTQAEQAKQQQEVAVKPSEKQVGSDLAVKAPQGSYAEYLTEAERSALDLLFERFGDSGRFGSAFNRDAGSDQSKTVGKVIDLKV